MHGNQGIFGFAIGGLDDTSYLGQHRVDSSFGSIGHAQDGPNVFFNCGLYNDHDVTLGGNRTLVFMGARTGQKILITVIQDSTGSRSPTLSGTFTWPGATIPTFTTTAGKKDVIALRCTGSNTFDAFVVGQNL